MIEEVMPRSRDDKEDHIGSASPRLDDPELNHPDDESSQIYEEPTSEIAFGDLDASLFTGGRLALGRPAENERGPAPAGPIDPAASGHAAAGLSNESSYPTAVLAGDDVPIAARLLVLREGLVESHALPDTGRMVIGRSKDCDIRIEHGSVSRHHAELRLGVDLEIKDLGSSNGTYVRGRRLESDRLERLAPGVTMRIGSVMTVVRPGSGGLNDRTGTSDATWGADQADAPLSIQEVERFISVVAPSDLSVIMLGETGVGKTRLAQQLHALSPRGANGRMDRFVALNCAAFPESMLEAELFGYERGAFTGAVTDKAGFLEAADGGTLLLDEVGDLPLPMQAKILHVLENGESMRLGARRARSVDVRFVAATNRDLEEMVEAGRFRRDLYFRLNGISIAIPPLRSRKDELDGLCEHFLRKLCEGRRAPIAVLSDEAREALHAYSFPGNVRELKSILERAVLLAGNAPIGTMHLGLRGGSAPPPPPSSPTPSQSTASSPPPSSIPSSSISEPQTLRRDVAALERERIVAALRACQGNQTQAAKRLGIARRTLINRMEEFGLPRPRRDR